MLVIVESCSAQQIKPGVRAESESESECVGLFIFGLVRCHFILTCSIVFCFTLNRLNPPSCRSHSTPHAAPLEEVSSRAQPPTWNANTAASQPAAQPSVCAHTLALKAATWPQPTAPQTTLHSACSPVGCAVWSGCGMWWLWLWLTCTYLADVFNLASRVGAAGCCTFQK